MKFECDCKDVDEVTEGLEPSWSYGAIAQEDELRRLNIILPTAHTTQPPSNAAALSLLPTIAAAGLGCSGLWRAAVCRSRKSIFQAKFCSNPTEKA